MPWGQKSTDKQLELGKHYGGNRASQAQKGAAPPKDGTVPFHKLPEPISAADLGKIIDHVVRRLTQADAFDDAWDEQFGPECSWHPDPDDAESDWARVVTELFLGAAYMMPLVAYDMDSRLDNSTRARGFTMPLESWNQYVFSRIERRPRRVAYGTVIQNRIDSHGRKYQQAVHSGAFNVTSWDDPEPPTRIAEPEAENADPAVSIAVCCEHLATYGVLSRGFSLVDDLNGIGLPASSRAMDAQAFSRGAWVPSAELIDVPAVFKQAPKLTPGSVFVYSPDGGLTTIEMKLSNYELKYRRDQCLIELFRTRVSVGVNQFDDKVRLKDAAPDYSKEIERDKAATDKAFAETQAVFDKLVDGPTKTKWQGVLDHAKELAAATIEDRRRLNKDTSVQLKTVTLGQQLSGSHIQLILRVPPEKNRLQFLDVTVSDTTVSSLAKNADEVVLQVHNALVDGNATTAIPNRAGKAFFGVGVLPPVAGDQLTEQAKWLAKARPVGLARLAITMRVPMITLQHVLYVSRLIRMYGDADEDNYTISRLLWSLRTAQAVGALGRDPVRRQTERGEDSGHLTPIGLRAAW